MIKRLFLRDGWFTLLGSFSCFAVGLLIVGSVVWFEPQPIVAMVGLITGLPMMGLAGYEARARAIGLQPPFTRDPLGWRKAKESYNTPKNPTDEKSADK